jgi:pyruvate,water dikinase
MKEVFASLYNDRAISYRVHKGFAHADVALSAGVQRMVRSDLGAAGVMFTIDTESGFEGRGLHHRQLRPGRDGGAGRGQPRRVLCAQAHAEGGPQAVIRRNLGSKLHPHGIATPDGRRLATGKLVRTVDTRPSSATATR